MSHEPGRTRRAPAPPRRRGARQPGRRRGRSFASAPPVAPRGRKPLQTTDGRGWFRTSDLSLVKRRGFVRERAWRATPDRGRLPGITGGSGGELEFLPDQDDSTVRHPPAADEVYSVGPRAVGIVLPEAAGPSSAPAPPGATGLRLSGNQSRAAPRSTWEAEEEEGSEAIARPRPSCYRSLRLRLHQTKSRLAPGCRGSTGGLAPSERDVRNPVAPLS
jgi:hypothetical protein